MKKYIKITTGIMMFLASAPVFSQTYTNTENENEAKYWVWRDRLVNDFMVPGNCVGCGIIMTQRGQYPVLPPSEWTGGFVINDEGWPQGYYLAVLATEWKLLHEAGQSTTKTEEELYYALKTLDRLDISAENYWAEYWGNGYDYPYLNTDYNGCMIRDDIFDESNPHGDAVYITPPGYTSYTDDYGKNSYDKFLHLNSDKGTAGKYVKQSILPMNGSGNILSLNDWATATVGNQYFPNGYRPGAAASGIHTSYDNGYGWLTGPEESSQDHYIGMMIGLCTIIQCIPASYEWHKIDDCSDVENFNQHAKDILSRIVHFEQNSWDDYHLDNDDNSYKQQCVGAGDPRCWLLTNPVTGMCLKGVAWHDYLDNYNNIIGGNSYCACLDGGAIATFLSLGVSHIYNHFVGGSDINDCNLGFHYDHHAYSPTLFTLSNVNTTLISNNADAVTIVDGYTNLRDKDELVFLDLLYCFLNSGTPERSLNNVYPHDWEGYYDNFLSDFPYLDNLGPNDIVEIPYHEVNFDNMLPEMLTHNLLKLLKGHSYLFPQYANLDDITDYPFNSDNKIVGTGSGTSCSNPWTKTQINSFNTITSSAKIGKYTNNNCTWTGFVQYTAAKKITLQQGFKVSDGAFFDAQIDTQNQLIDSTGDYSWLNNVCEPCSNMPTIFSVNYVVTGGETELCDGGSAKLNTIIEKPYICYFEEGTETYKWIISSPYDYYESSITSSNAIEYNFDAHHNPDPTDFSITSQYYFNGNLMDSKDWSITVHPWSDCHLQSKINDSTSTDTSNINSKLADNLTSSDSSGSETIGKIFIYPNPTDGIFTVASTNTDKLFSVEVTNVFGESIFSESNIKNKVQFNLSSMAKGVYFVKTFISGSSESVKKIIYQ